MQTASSTPHQGKSDLSVLRKRDFKEYSTGKKQRPVEPTKSSSKKGCQAESGADDTTHVGEKEDSSGKLSPVQNFDSKEIDEPAKKF